MTRLFIFPTIIESKVLEKNTDQLKENTNFVESRNYDLNAKGDFNSLNRFPRVKKIILGEFKNFMEEIGYGRDFKISSSWFTSTHPGEDGIIHNHQNSFYSGIYYYDEYDDDSGEIMFENPSLRSNGLYVIPKEYTPINYNCWKCKPEKRLLIFFPSYIMHKIEKNRSDKIRHSLAFNFIPSGGFGIMDSHININN